MVAQLIVRGANGSVNRIPLDRERVTIGRGPGNDLAFPADTSLSRHHLVFARRGDSWLVRDLDTKNGTLLNGVRISEERVVHPGDVVSAGELTIGIAVPLHGEPETCTTLDQALSGAFGAGDLQDSAIGVLVRVSLELARPTAKDWCGFILRSAIEGAGADRGSLMLLEDERLVVHAQQGTSSPISTTVMDRVLHRRMSVMIRDTDGDSLFDEANSLVLQSVRTLIAVPVQTEQTVLGLIYVDAIRPWYFTAEHLSLVTVLAHLAAMRLEHDRVTEQERERRAEVERMARAAEDHRRALEAAEAMRHAEARAVLAETATSMSRLAAALSHELNTPLGVLKSSVETLVRAVNRSRPVNEPGRFPEVVEELRSSIIASIDRLSGIVSRLQRITNLDRAEVQPIQLGQHLNDVVATLATDKDIRVELPELPAVVCRPQVLSAIFSILLHNCVSRQVFVRAGAAANSLLLRIEQPGHVIPEATLDELFDPAFRVVDGRMATGNWGLFSARQVMRELGGDVTADSNESSGTVFTVIIPRECQP